MSPEGGVQEPWGVGCPCSSSPSLTRVCSFACSSFDVNLRAVIQVSQVSCLQGRHGNCWVTPV